MANNRLAYWDSFSGLVPCRVIRIERSPDPDWRDPFGHDYGVVAVLTASRGPYRCGERIAQSPMHVWPRDCVRNKRGTYGRTKIVAPYDWAARIEGATT